VHQAATQRRQRPEIDGFDEAPAAGPKPRAEPASPVALSVVAPCFNEEQGLMEFHRRMSAAISAAGETSYEIVLVDDGSTDATWTVIDYLVDFDPHVVGIKLSRNHGHQLALTAGLSRCRGDQVLVIDADLQDPPELLADMRATMHKAEADVVYGRRIARSGETRFKKLTAAVFYRLLARLTDTVIPVDTGDFRLISGRVARLIARLPERDRFVRGLVSWAGFRQVPFDYSRDSRFAGKTKYPLRKMLAFASDAILGFSMFPVRLAGIISACFFVTLLALLGYVALSWMFLTTVPGWTSLAIIVLATSAVQMFTLSVIGEYVGRIYIEGKRRPLFIIEEIVTNTDELDGGEGQ
jgi:dolichol-phosphate mannosyltransferase